VALRAAAMAVGIFVILSPAAGYELPNGYSRLAGSGGEITSRRCDPAAAGRWGDNIVLSLFADNDYLLYVNGQLVGQGSDWQQVDRFDVQNVLRRGENVIAVKAHNADGPAGLLAQLTLSGPPGRVITDASWRVALSEQTGWREPGFDDTRWAHAETLGSPPIDPWGAVHPAPENITEVTK